MRLLLPLILFVSPLPAVAETLLVGNKSEDTVSFIDLATGTERARVGEVLRRIPVGKNGDGLAIAP